MRSRPEYQEPKVRTAEEMRAELTTLETMLADMDKKKASAMDDVEARVKTLDEREMQLNVQSANLAQRERTLKTSEDAYKAFVSETNKELSAKSNLIAKMEKDMAEDAERQKKKAAALEEESSKLRDWRHSLSDQQKELDQVLAKAQRIVREATGGKE